MVSLYCKLLFLPIFLRDPIMFPQHQVFSPLFILAYKNMSLKLQEGGKHTCTQGGEKGTPPPPPP